MRPQRCRSRRATRCHAVTHAPSLLVTHSTVPLDTSATSGGLGPAPTPPPSRAALRHSPTRPCPLLPHSFQSAEASTAPYIPPNPAPIFDLPPTQHVSLGSSDQYKKSRLGDRLDIESSLLFELNENHRQLPSDAPIPPSSNDSPTMASSSPRLSVFPLIGETLDSVSPSGAWPDGFGDFIAPFLLPPVEVVRERYDLVMEELLDSAAPEECAGCGDPVRSGSRLFLIPPSDEDAEAGGYWVCETCATGGWEDNDPVDERVVGESEDDEEVEEEVEEGDAATAA